MIRIISGTYGHREKGHVVPKTSKSEPFSLDKKEEERLVKAGVAAYVDGEKSSTKNGGKAEGKAGGKTSEKAEEKAGEAKGEDVPAPSFDAKGTVV